MEQVLQEATYNEVLLRPSMVQSKPLEDVVLSFLLDPMELRRKTSKKIKKIRGQKSYCQPLMHDLLTKITTATCLHQFWIPLKEWVTFNDS